MSDERETVYLCHACGTPLERVTYRPARFYCRRCRMSRRRPRDRALRFTPPLAKDAGSP